MKPYCSLHSGKASLANQRARGWGLLVTPDTYERNRVPSDVSIAIDNGAWGAFAGNRQWDAAKFVEVVELYGHRADFVVCPDVVGDADGTLALLGQWFDWCLSHVRRVLIAVQDGMRAAHIAWVLSSRVGIFVGGSSEFKERTMGEWAELAREHGAYIHVGRVNSARRIHMCAAAHVDSFDGNSPVLFPSTLQQLDNARKQSAFWF